MLRAEFRLPSIVDEEATPERKAPIRVKFEIPYFTVSGIQVLLRIQHFPYILKITILICIFTLFKNEYFLYYICPILNHSLTVLDTTLTRII